MTDEFPMKSILAVYLTKEFGSYMEVSSIAAKETDLLKVGVKKMAGDIVESALLSGHRPTEETGRVILHLDESGVENPLRDRKTVGALCHSAFEATPAQFVAFCGFRLDEARGERDKANLDRDYYKSRCNRLAALIQDCWSIRSARKLARRIP